MNKITHHPDGHIIINDKLIALSKFISKFPTYKLPEGVISREYVEGSHHFLSTGKEQLQGEFPWIEADEYIKALPELTKVKKVREKKVVQIAKPVVPLETRLNSAVTTAGGLKLTEIGNYGNVWIRKQFYPKKEIIHDGHKHNHDHVSLLSGGSVLVEVEGEVATVFKSPTFFTVAANKCHTITALEDNTCVFCIYGLVDKDGNPTDTFNGDNSPYGHKVN